MLMQTTARHAQQDSLGKSYFSSIGVFAGHESVLCVVHVKLKYRPPSFATSRLADHVAKHTTIIIVSVARIYFTMAIYFLGSYFAATTLTFFFSMTIISFWISLAEGSNSRMDFKIVVKNQWYISPPSYCLARVRDRCLTL